MPTSIRIPDDINKRLTELAQATGRTKAFYIKEALNEHLAKLEEIYLAEKKRTEALRSGKTKR